MHWNEMTAAEFKNAVDECERVCVFSIGCLEQHGDHLPLGIDYMKGWHFTDLAAEKEKAIVFPPYYYGSVTAAAKWPGCVALPSPLLLEILSATFKEISRNGPLKQENRSCRKTIKIDWKSLEKPLKLTTTFP